MWSTTGEMGWNSEHSPPWGAGENALMEPFLCTQVAVLPPLLHPCPHRLPAGLPGVGQALPLPPHHVSPPPGPGWGCPRGAILPRSPLSLQDAVLWAPDPHPQLVLHGCGHSSSSGEWGPWGGCGVAERCPNPLCSVSSPQGTSDFCVAPDKFIMNQTDSDISAGREP